MFLMRNPKLVLVLKSDSHSENASVLRPTHSAIHGQSSCTPRSHTRLLFNRFLYEYDTEPHQIFKNRPSANTCEYSARRSKVLHSMLGRANHIWRASHPHEFYGESYKKWTNTPISTNPPG